MQNKKKKTSAKDWLMLLGFVAVFAFILWGLGAVAGWIENQNDKAAAEKKEAQFENYQKTGRKITGCSEEWVGDKFVKHCKQYDEYLDNK